MIKIALLLGLVGIAAASYIGGHDDYNHHPAYNFEYSVHDPHTHDIKSQHESRNGDSVKGYYTLKEADGTLREVHYTADHKNGFNAEVKRSGHAQHPAHYHSSAETFYGHGHSGASSSNNNNLYNGHHY
ncbi:cuticle protein 19 [Hylaeus volcanicus]|uniref:cuticle protein 19 n=1 Tax=Hylaeus volcanicus TaxID=313075 RepID=UPI0023B841BB|nr:cuticle protein 19 [Hylaeus volcanicus]